MILLCANTAHIVAERVAAILNTPLIDIRLATAAAIAQKKLTTVGLLGTTYTMELDFYQHTLRENGIRPIVPTSKAERDFIEYSLLNELGKGILSPHTKEVYLQIIEGLIERGAKGIILGCTEIPLLIGQDDIPVPVFNTTEIHAKAAVRQAMQMFNNQPS
jgi:aspartate racemase